jgi:hypothetical protein
MPEHTTSCAPSVLLSRAKCFEKNCLGPSDLEGIEIYARVANLAASGGDDYTGNINALLTACKTYQAIPGDQRKAIDLLLTIDNANDNGAVVSYDPNVLKKNAAGYISLGIELQKQVLLFLKCQLGKLDKPA